MADVGKVFYEPIGIELPDFMELSGCSNSEKRFAIDVGCSLTKVAYYSTVRHKYLKCQRKGKNKNNGCEYARNIHSEKREPKSEECKINGRNNYESDESSHSEEGDNQSVSNCRASSSQICNPKHCKPESTSRLHFAKFQTKHLDQCITFIKDHLLRDGESISGKSVKVTGRGAYKYGNCIKDKLGVLLDKEDEMCCLIKGTNFLLKNVDGESFAYLTNGNPHGNYENSDSTSFHPYLLVNVGSGVSIFKVTNEDCYEKIGGLSTGGATFWGLGSLLTSAKEFDDLLDLAESGDYRKVDLLTRDLLDGDYANAGLSEDVIAASFGKVNFHNGDLSQKKFSEADIARSLLLTIANTIGQVSSLYATLHNVNKVYFGGHFICNSPLHMEFLSQSFSYWSNNKIRPLFLRHEGYLGAVGAFLTGMEQCREESWTMSLSSPSSPFSSDDRRYSGSYGGSGKSIQSAVGDDDFSVCPLLLQPESYRPDTVDLIQDEEAREYWLQCFEETVEKFAKKAVESQPNSSTAVLRANSFKEKFLDRLQQLKVNPTLYGILTVRGILDTIHLFLKEFDFPDPYLSQKEMENEKALSMFAEHIKFLDELETNTRHGKLILFLVAGNMFDWGAKEVSALMETKNFGFEDALNKIPQRPWLIDSLDDWIERLKKPPHRCAVVFVDNSGLDIILGILPFVREILKRGTEVILCSNSFPALNDVVHTEMLAILKRIKEICPIIRDAEESGRLIAMETGQSGPCLDLSRLKKDLCEEMVKRKADLIVIEGMGRSVHTNLNTEFKCESLKVAVIKNRWLAQRLGGTMFCVLCQYKHNNSS